MHRRARRLVIALVVVATSISVVPSLTAQAAAASMSGVVTDAVTGAPIARACVEVYDDSFSFVGQACTTTTGAWHLGRLKAGAAYEVQASAGGYAAQWANGEYDINDATAITAPSTVSFALEHSGHLAGTLLNSDGTVPTDGEITVHRLDEFNAQTQSGVDPASGAWDTSLAPGTYEIEFQSGPIDRWAPDQLQEHGSQTFTVTAGQTTTADLTLPKRITVSGTVTSAVTGLALQGICVTVGSLSGIGQEGDACTGADGTYTVEMGAPGSFYVSFRSDSGTYGFQYYPGAATPGRATRLTLGQGDQLTGIDASLATGATIVGRAVGALSHQPLENACGYVNFGHTGGYPFNLDTVCSGADGTFTISGLAATSYAVAVNVGILQTWAPAAQTQAGATLYSPAAGQTLDVGDVQVAPGGTISGTVTDAVTGKPLKGIIVGGYGPREGEGGQWSATTNAAGHYVIQQVPAGPRPLVAWTFDPAYAPSWYGGAPDPSTATPVAVVDGRTTHANFSLSAGATISGSLVSATGAPVTKSYVLEAFSVASPAQDLGISSDVNNGAFTITGLPASPVILQFSNPTNGNKVAFYYDGATTAAAAKQITPLPGATVTVTAHTP